MNKLNECLIPLSGIIVFGSRPGMGLTTTTLKLANQIAQSKNVIFISYQDYEEKLLKILERHAEAVSRYLTINTSFDFYGDSFVQDISELMASKSVDTVVIDDLDSMLGEYFDLEIRHRDMLLQKLQALTRVNNTRIILNVTVSQKVEYRNDSKKPMLRDFTWSRNLMGIADQVYTIYRPEYYLLVEDENGKSTSGRIDIDLIKDRECKEAQYIDFTTRNV